MLQKRSIFVFAGRNGKWVGGEELAWWTDRWVLNFLRSAGGLYYSTLGCVVMVFIVYYFVLALLSSFICLLSNILMPELGNLATRALCIFLYVWEELQLLHAQLSRGKVVRSSTPAILLPDSSTAGRYEWSHNYPYLRMYTYFVILRNTRSCHPLTWTIVQVMPCHAIQCKISNASLSRKLGIPLIALRISKQLPQSQQYISPIIVGRQLWGLSEPRWESSVSVLRTIYELVSISNCDIYRIYEWVKSDVGNKPLFLCPANPRIVVVVVVGFASWGHVLCI